MKRTKGQKKGRIAVVLGISIIAAFLAIGMAGCSSSEQKQDAGETTAAAEQQAAGTESSEETTAAAEEESQTAESEETTKATETKQTKEEAKAAKAEKNTAAATKKSDAAKKPAQTAKADKKSEKPKKSTTEKKQKKSTTKATTKATQANVCYVTVDGYCSGKSVSLQGGDTVYSVLKQCGASVSAEKSQYGVYVKGINGRFEFDEGPASGWKYSVNGSNPSKAADKCSVGKGDIVKWYYIK